MKISAVILLLSLSATSFIAEAQKEITIKNLYSDHNVYAQTPSELTSLANGESYAQTDGKTIKIYSYKTGNEEGTIMDLDKVRETKIESIDGFTFSDNEQKILVWNNTQSLYRHSFTADYYVYDIKYNELKPVSDNGPVRDAHISPDGSMVAYVYNNNIYIKKFRYNSTSAVTTDGKTNAIINGAPDWVYEEEFAMTSAMEWSPDSKQLAFIRFDESEVKSFSFPVYNAGQNSQYATYPGTYEYKYPKAGEKNSSVSVLVHNVDNRQTKTMDLGNMNNMYIPRIKWTYTDGQLAIYRLNRRQDNLEIMLANTASTVCKTIVTDHDSRYIDEFSLDNSLFLPDGQTFIFTSAEDGWNHIYVYGTNGVLRTKLTKGEWDVTALVGYNPTTKTIYYEAARTSPINRDIYSVSIDGKIEKRLSSGDGTTHINLSASGKYYSQVYSDAQTPYQFTIHESATGKKLWTVFDNKSYKNTINSYNFHKKEFITVPGADGTQLNAWIVKPSNFNASKKYPLLMVQYSGPNSQQVLNKWSIDWEQALASEGYIVACVDGRGTGCRGAEFQKCTYQRLGRYESDDQIAAAKHFASLPYVDESRIGIWGWSFGGFMSSLCLCRTDIFKAGIAVAPVTSWRFYDTIYAERYMRTPQENISGYDSYCPLALADKLSGKLFLIHGTADDNVHLQNQTEFTSALIEANKQFDMFCYPNKNHGIYGGNTRFHLYTMMFNWIKTNL